MYAVAIAISSRSGTSVLGMRASAWRCALSPTLVVSWEGLSAARSALGSFAATAPAVPERSPEAPERSPEAVVPGVVPAAAVVPAAGVDAPKSEPPSAGVLAAAVPAGLVASLAPAAAPPKLNPPEEAPAAAELAQVVHERRIHEHVVDRRGHLDDVDAQELRRHGQAGLELWRHG